MLPRFVLDRTSVVELVELNYLLVGSAKVPCLLVYVVWMNLLVHIVSKKLRLPLSIQYLSVYSSRSFVDYSPLVPLGPGAGVWCSWAARPCSRAGSRRGGPRTQWW